MREWRIVHGEGCAFSDNSRISMLAEDHYLAICGSIYVRCSGCGAEERFHFSNESGGIAYDKVVAAIERNYPVFTD